MTEAVPFRFTPNLQAFFGQLNIEGAFVVAVFAIAQVLCKSGSEWRDFLQLLVRDEIFAWTLEQDMKQAPSANVGLDVYTRVTQNFEIIFKRAQTISCAKDVEAVLFGSLTIGHRDVFSCIPNDNRAGIVCCKSTKACPNGRPLASLVLRALIKGNVVYLSMLSMLSKCLQVS